MPTFGPTGPIEAIHRRAIAVVTTLASLTIAAGCGKVPSPDQLFADKKAEQRRSICLSWQYGPPRQILTDAGRGGSDRKVLAQMLLPEWKDDDPPELKDAFNALHTGAGRLQRGEDSDTVLRDSEPAMASTDRFFATQCAPIIAGSGSTISTR